jgi:hypothetical protein
MTTRAEWRQKILDELGGNAADPSELEEGNLDAALRSALELFNKFRPIKQWFPFDIASTGGTETFIISFFADPERTDPLAHPDTYIRTVLDVNFSEQSQVSLGPRGISDGYFLRWGHEGPRLFYQVQVAKRVYEKLTGSQPDFWWNASERKLYITSPGRPRRCMVLCSRERTLEEIPYDYASDFLQAAVAKAKFFYARIVGGRGPILGSAGPIETDAALLRAEGQAEWKDVESKLARALTSVPPPRWVG